MIRKPLLFVDVDGVLNTMLAPAEQAQQTTDQDGFPIWVPHGTAERISRLLEHFEPVWATAWFDRAPATFTPMFGLDSHWPVLDWDDMKLPAVLQHAGSRPFAFIDDDIGSEIENHSVEPYTPSAHQLLLPIPPDTGLDDSHVEQLIAFARRH